MPVGTANCFLDCIGADFMTGRPCCEAGIRARTVFAGVVEELIPFGETAAGFAEQCHTRLLQAVDEHAEGYDFFMHHVSTEMNRFSILAAMFDENRDVNGCTKNLYQSLRTLASFAEAFSAATQEARNTFLLVLAKTPERQSIAFEELRRMLADIAAEQRHAA